MKRLSSFGGILITVGIIIILVSIHRVGYDLRNFSTVTTFTEKEYVFDPSVHTLEITDSDCEIVLSPSYDGKIHILLFENETDTYVHNRFDHSAGTKLTFENISAKKWYEKIFDWNNEKRYFTVLIPDTSSVHIGIKGENTPLLVSDVMCASLDVITNSSVEIDTLMCAEQLEVSSSDSGITLADITCGDVTVNTTNAPISANRVMSGGKAMLVTTNASISVNRIGVSDGLTLKTLNGKITGSVTGTISDFDVSVRADKCNIPCDLYSGDIPLVLEALNDRINLSFVK